MHYVPIPTYSKIKIYWVTLIFIVLIYPRLGSYSLHSLQVHISHFQDFIFDLNAVKEPASLYADGSFAQIIGALM